LSAFIEHRVKRRSRQQARKYGLGDRADAGLRRLRSIRVVNGTTAMVNAANGKSR
jgi:hypothetical protein